MILLPHWHAILKNLKLKDRIMPCNVLTWWNLTYEMLQFAIKYHNALNKITGEKELNLHAYEMDNKEWGFAEQLSEVLKVCILSIFACSPSHFVHPQQIFKDATLFFLHDGVPNIVMVIPAMNHIDKILTTNALNSHYSVAIKIALTIGKKMLNHYYSKMDLSDVYRIAMGKPDPTIWIMTYYILCS